ncbi:DUF4290 domain-containing protein [Sphingobacterium corticibacterium]|uniref:DUF4290 domain-containing protein n=1 Tax=Sphingobacterium corticibacterium TaxID=2484746 RepID=A0A4Q6XWZ4_9SPHI|nr:DUF4290 domain-containing protein [Sphingobacterium corticibacterium]RZF62282.1 DUF4290 domain-containing protein [Sphingobacterium corticibacterium]
MDFDYNSTRSKLILAEYGRNVQNMVDYICTLPTKEERNRYAQVVIDMMGVLNPHLRDVSDFKHKLWDHLHIISDFKIDVDSPYPIPARDAIHKKPDLLDYPQHSIRYKHYGHTIERMIEKALAMPAPENRERMALSIANFMKMAYMTWNKDTVQDDHIIQNLAELSNGLLTLPADTVLTKLDFKTPPPGSRTKSGTTPTNNNNQKNNQKSNGKKNMVKKKNGPKKVSYRR